MSANAGEGLGETEKDCGTGALNRSGVRVWAELWPYPRAKSQILRAKWALPRQCEGRARGRRAPSRDPRPFRRSDPTRLRYAWARQAEIRPDPTTKVPRAKSSEPNWRLARPASPSSPIRHLGRAGALWQRRLAADLSRQEALATFSDSRLRGFIRPNRTRMKNQQSTEKGASRDFGTPAIYPLGSPTLQPPRFPSAASAGKDSPTLRPPRFLSRHLGRLLPGLPTRLRYAPAWRAIIRISDQIRPLKCQEPNHQSQIRRLFARPASPSSPIRHLGRAPVHCGSGVSSLIYQDRRPSLPFQIRDFGGLSDLIGPE